MPYIERYIDYIQFSALVDEAKLSGDKIKQIQPVAWYKRGYVDDMGFRLYFGNNKSKKALIHASGKTLELMRETKNNAEICRWVLSQEQSTITRLDLAVTQWNIFDGFTTTKDVVSWYEKGLVESYLTSGGGKTIQSTNIGSESVYETFYIGNISKRGKKGIFRAYDKGIELDLGQYFCTRLELEERGENAHNTALRIEQHGDISGNFRARFNVRHKDFDRLMDADAVTIQRGQGKGKQAQEDEMKNRWIWAMQQVAPSIKEAWEYDKRTGSKSNRMYWFLRELGLDGEKLIALFVDKKEEMNFNRDND